MKREVCFSAASSATSFASSASGVLRVRGLSPAPLTYVLRSSLALIFCFSDTLFLVVTFHLGVSSSAPVLLRGFHGGVFLRLRLLLLLLFSTKSLLLSFQCTRQQQGVINYFAFLL